MYWLRIWQNQNSCTLFVRNVKCVASMKHNMEVPKKVKIELCFDPPILFCGCFFKILNLGS